MRLLLLFCRSRKSLTVLIEVKIVLGRLSYVQVNNTSALAEGQAEKAAGILQKGELLRTDRLETVLNNINDLAGVTA